MHLYEEKQHGPGWRLLVSVALFAALAAAFLLFLSRTGRRTERQQQDQLSASIQHALVTCYAIEGRYPPTLGYLCDNYGVRYDASRFFVFYEAYASNLKPAVSVSAKGGR